MSGFASARGDANAGIVSRLNSATASNAANYLTLPTPDGLGQMVHPDVWDFGTAWNGWRYWLAITPYSNTDATTENPCILVSNDKTTWSIPSGGSNPIDPAPGGGRYNSDDDLWYEGGTLYCFWRSTVLEADPISDRDSSFQSIALLGCHLGWSDWSYFDQGYLRPDLGSRHLSILAQGCLAPLPGL